MENQQEYSDSRCRIATAPRWPASFMCAQTINQYLKLLSSSWNPQHRAPINREPKKSLGIQAHLTNVRHERRSPRRELLRFGRDDCCASRITCLDGRVSSGAPAAYTAVARTLTERTVTHRESKSPQQLRSPAMCTMVLSYCPNTAFHWSKRCAVVFATDDTHAYGSKMYPKSRWSV